MAKLFGIEFQRATTDLAAKKDRSSINTDEKAVVRDSVEELMDEYGTYDLEAEGELPIETYRKMMRREPQVKAAVHLKIHARVASGYEIRPASSKAEDKRVAQFIEDQIDRMDGTMDKFLRRALLAMAYGQTIHEMVLEPLTEGKWRGKIGLKALKWKKPERFQVKTDRYGNIETLQHYVDGKWKPLPHEYFVIYAWDHEGDWRGKSDLRPAYKYYRSKDLTDRFWNLFSEKYASPTPVGKHPPGANYTEKRELLNFLSNLNLRKAAVYPKNWDVELLEAQRQGGTYEQRLLYCDRMMARAILMPTLLIDEGQSGAYALGQQHAKNFVWVLKSMGEELAQEIVGEQLIRRLVDMNFNVSSYPELIFKPFDPNELLKQAESFANLIDKGIVVHDEEFIRERLGLPPVEEGMQLPKPAVGGVNAQPDSNGQDSEADGDPMNRPETRKPDGPSTPATKLTAGEAEVEFAALSPAASKFRVAETSAALDKLESETVDVLAAVTEEWKSSIIRQLREKKIIANRDYDAVNRLSIPSKSIAAFRSTLESMLGNAIHIGSSNATDELERGGFDPGTLPDEMDNNLGISFTAKVNGASFSAEGEIIDFWDGKTAIQRALLEEYSREAFTITGVFRDDILDGAQQIISRGIRRGSTASMVEDELAAFFRPYVASGGASGVLLDPFRLETLVRTNMSEAYNSGRMNLFMHPSVGDFIVAYEYSAILDRNTTPFCREWHGTVLRADDPRVISYNPPNHFRCRSVWIPITRGEEHTLTEEQSILGPQTGFLGCYHGGHENV